MDLGENITKRYLNGDSARSLAKELGVSTRSITRFLQSNGVQLRNLSETIANKLVIGEDLGRRIQSLYESGKTRDQVISELGVSEWTVRKCIDKFRSPQEQRNIINTRNTHELSESKRQCILGTLLGDGSIIHYRNSYVFQVSHGDSQKGYVEHIGRTLGVNKITSSIVKNGYKPGSIKHKISYQNKGALEKIFRIVAVGGKKRINQRWVQEVGVEGIAYWFMDDGSTSYSHSGTPFARFSTLSFDEEEIELARSLLKKFGIGSTLVKSKYGKGTIISIPSKDTYSLMNMVRPYVDSIECMKYKIKYKETK